jgi:apolipoprotein N-acyltransferase
VPNKNSTNMRKIFAVVLFIIAGLLIFLTLASTIYNLPKAIAHSINGTEQTAFKTGYIIGLLSFACCLIWLATFIIKQAKKLFKDKNIPI